MMAPRTNIIGAIFAQPQQSLEEIVQDLRTELTQTRNQLVEEQRKRAMAEADAARLRRNELLRNDPHPPEGDMKRGYFCACCGHEFYAPFDEQYCCMCGKKADWRTNNEYDVYGRRAE